MQGGLFVDNANLVVNLDYGKHRHVRLDYDAFPRVIAREVERLSGKPVTFGVRTLYASWLPDEDRRPRERFWAAIQAMGWSVSSRPLKRYGDGHVEEKGTDLSIALDALGMAFRGYIDCVAVVTDDSDFEALFERLPLSVKGFAVGWEKSMARELRRATTPIFLDPLLPEIEQARGVAPLSI